jgi:hypothetical protein
MAARGGAQQPRQIGMSLTVQESDPATQGSIAVFQAVRCVHHFRPLLGRPDMDRRSVPTGSAAFDPNEMLPTRDVTGA